MYKYINTCIYIGYMYICFEIYLYIYIYKLIFIQVNKYIYIYIILLATLVPTPRTCSLVLEHLGGFAPLSAPRRNEWFFARGGVASGFATGFAKGFAKAGLNNVAAKF